MNHAFLSILCHARDSYIFQALGLPKEIAKVRWLVLFGDVVGSTEIAHFLLQVTAILEVLLQG